tara:strand:+ start:17766 stop:17900 length:135 start_codon:yes stop_codon:yes gene_type:complete
LPLEETLVLRFFLGFGLGVSTEIEAAFSAASLSFIRLNANIPIS